MCGAKEEFFCKHWICFVFFELCGFFFSLPYFLHNVSRQDMDTGRKKEVSISGLEGNPESLEVESSLQMKEIQWGEAILARSAGRKVFR